MAGASVHVSNSSKFEDCLVASGSLAHNLVEPPFRLAAFDYAFEGTDPVAMQK